MRGYSESSEILTWEAEHSLDEWIKNIYIVPSSVVTTYENASA